MSKGDQISYYHDVFDGFFEGVQVVDFSLRYLYVNPVTERHGKRSASELLGRRMEDMYPGFAGTEAHRLIENCAAERKGHRFTNHFSYPDGTKAWFELMISPVPVGVMIVSVDVSAQMAMQAEFERSNRDLAQFATVAAHDLQEPLRKIRAFGDLLQNELSGLGPAKAKEYAASIQASAGRLQGLIRGLLGYANVGAQESRFEELDLGPVLDAALQDLELLLKDSRLSVDCGELPRLEADPLLMRQLFQNLISNAAKFQDPGRQGRLEIRSRAADGGVEIAFRDNGIGFDQRYADKVFTIFQRLHDRDQYDGGGLGLAICRRIAEHHQGGIRAESVPGQGSVFYLFLPMKQKRLKPET